MSVFQLGHMPGGWATRLLPDRGPRRPGQRGRDPRRRRSGGRSRGIEPGFVGAESGGDVTQEPAAAYAADRSKAALIIRWEPLNRRLSP